jgi:LysM repeat protein
MKRRRVNTLSLKTFIFCGLFVFILLVFACSSFADAHNNSEKYYTSVYVESGDTLWSFADRYCSVEYNDKDEYIKEVMRLNHLTSSDIHSGSYLILPYYDSKSL